MYLVISRGRCMILEEKDREKVKERERERQRQRQSETETIRDRKDGERLR